MTERLQKLLSQRGIASRRQAEKLIFSGRVTVNGKVAEIGQQADPSCDRICVDGVELGKSPRFVYLLLNKPKGVITTCEDPQGRQTVLDLLESSVRKGSGIHPVGRLDRDSSGALLLTNDGQLTYQLTHPRHQMPKVYQAKVKGVPSEAALQRWREGVILSGRKTLPAEVRRIRPKRQPLAYGRDHESDGTLNGTWDDTCLEITLREGRNRQIRRVAALLGHPVTALHRLKIGSLSLGNLPRGRYRLLSDQEIARLKREAAVIPFKRGQIQKGSNSQPR